MKKVFPAMLVFVFACASAWTAERVPAPTASEQTPVFESVDSDTDGAISKHEAMGIEILGAGFDGADRNGDGMLSPQEYRAAMQIGQGS